MKKRHFIFFLFNFLFSIKKRISTIIFSHTFRHFIFFPLCFFISQNDSIPKKKTKSIFEKKKKQNKKEFSTFNLSQIQSWILFSIHSINR